MMTRCERLMVTLRGEPVDRPSINLHSPAPGSGTGNSTPALARSNPHKTSAIKTKTLISRSFCILVPILCSFRILQVSIPHLTRNRFVQKLITWTKLGSNRGPFVIMLSWYLIFCFFLENM